MFVCANDIYFPSFKLFLFCLCVWDIFAGWLVLFVFVSFIVFWVSVFCSLSPSFFTRGGDVGGKNEILISPAPVAQWLARRTVGRKVWGSNPIRVMWDFSALAGSYPELGRVLWAQWEGWNHTAELHPLNGCVFEGVALITWPTLQVPQFPGLVNTGIIVTVSVVCGPVK